MIHFSYKSNKPFSTDNRFLPLLTLLSKYPFPVPSEVSKRYGQTETHFAISSFTDKKLLRSLMTKMRSKIQWVTIDDNSTTHLRVNFLQKEENVILLTNEMLFLSAPQTKQFFYEMVKCENIWSLGICEVLGSDIYLKNFTRQERDEKTMLMWLQYFGSEEIIQRGGFAAFESNPYLYTERIHDGLYVQVGGDDPAIFDTPEGEKLLVNAINALPLIQKD